MRVLITGGSMGLGKALAYQYASVGYDLSIVSRNKDELNKIKEDIEKNYKVSVDIYPYDLTNDIYPIFLKLKEKDIDIVINNAGMGISNEFLSHDIKKEEALINLNIKALTDFCYYFGNIFKEKKKGLILNISSVGSMMPGPYISTYYASKAYVSQLSISLYHEFKRYGVKIKAYNLCRIDTSFDIHAGRKPGSLKKGKDPKKIAKKIFKTSYKNKCIINVGFTTKLTNILRRILPIKVFLFFVGKSLES